MNTKTTPPKQSFTPLWWFLSWKELVSNRRFTALFIFNLSLGLTGFLALDTFKTSFHENLSLRSKAVLGADMSVRARRPLSAEEQKALKEQTPAGSNLRQEVSLFSMAYALGGDQTSSDGSGGNRTRLVEVRAVDKQFPFYGNLTLKESGKSNAQLLQQFTASSHQKPQAWIYPELQAQLGLNAGDEIKLGEATFVVSDVVLQDPSVSSVGFAVAPKVYIPLPALESTGLLQKGSRISRSWLFQLPQGTTPESIKETMRAAIPATDVRIRTHEEASEQMGRMISYLNDYLGLVALVAVFLAGVGASYLFRSFLGERSKDIAILLSLGTNHKLVRRTYICQLALLGLAATVVTLALSALIVPILPEVIQAIQGAAGSGSSGGGGSGGSGGSALDLSISLQTIVMAIFLGVGSSLLFCLPILARIASLNPQSLFQEAAQPALTFSTRQALGWIPALVIYWLLAVWQSQSLLTGTLFVGLFLSAAVFLGFGIWAILRITSRRSAQAKPSQSLARYLALTHLTRQRVATMASFLAIGLGSLLINLIPQIRTVLSAELNPPEDQPLPSLFLFDIQDEQVAGLRTFSDDNAAPLSDLSPMISARLQTINGTEVDVDPENGRLETREQQHAERMRNRTFNLSYRDGLGSAERLVSGEPLSGSYQWASLDPQAGGDAPMKPAEISLETRFAGRLGLKVGDNLTFDVQGIPIRGEVVNTRSVRWTSFRPNFFVSFQPGVLDDAPKTWVATVGPLPFEQKIAVQNKLVAKFPNIAIVDVTQTVQRILGVVEQMAWAISTMAWLSLIAGFAVLFSIGQHLAAQRVRDISLLKALGTPFQTLRGSTIWEFGLVGGLAAASGAAISVATSFLLARFLFDGAWVFDWMTPVTAFAGVTFMAVTTGLLATRRALQTPAQRWLAVQ